MFAESVILKKLADFKEAYGWMPVRHSIEEIEKASAYIQSLLTTNSRGEVFFEDHNWTPKLVQFVQNERAMCNPPEAPVWMADYTFKPIGEIKPGDEIIGWKREVRLTVKQARNGGRSRPMNLERLTKTKVVGVARRISKIVKVTMESGRVIRCTPDHLWSRGDSNRYKFPWQHPKVGRTLRRVVDVYPNESPDLRTAAWLGGLYDGEGHKNSISQSNHSNPELCQSIRNAFNRLGLPFAEYQPNDEGKTGRDRRAINFQILGGRDGVAKFAAWCKPTRTKSLDPTILKSLSAAPDKIVKVEDDGEGEVVSMQTETGNYVVWGYASKNCAMDCEYYLTRYYKIAANNRIVRFKMRSGQRVIYRVIQELEEQGRGIEIQSLKARQQGVTTLIEGIMSHRALFVPGAKCSIASADAQKTYVMMGMVYTAIDHIPWWLSPVKTKDKRSGSPILEFANIGTSVVIQSGTMKGGIGQGTTPTAIHLSEVCDYTDPVTQIEEGLFMAVHSGPEIFMVLESTGNGNTGWWADQWRNNKENYHKGDSRLLPLFLPWFMTPELFPPPDFREHHPVKPDWRPAEETIAMTHKCEAYANNTPILSRILGKNWKLPIEQQWFWEWKFMDARRRRTEKSWLRQMPCDDFEALIGDHDSVVGRDTLDLIEKTRQKQCEVYGILGEGIAERHEPPPMFIDPDADRLYSTWKTPKEEKLDWFFMPYLDTDVEKKDFNPLKKLLIWEHPQKDCDYSIGCDTGTGVGGDRSTVCVNRTGYDAACDVQVAEFASDDISNVELYAYVAAISAYYAQFMDEGRHPKLIIEQKRKYGDTCQHQLNLMGMRRHHEFVTYDKKTLKPKAREGSRLGWFTNEWSRPMLLSTFKYAIENGWFIVNSPFLKEEVEGWEQQLTVSGKTKMDHQTGKHDDRIFGAGMAYFTMHDLDVMIERAKKKFNKPDEEGYVISYEPFYHQATAGGDRWAEVFGG